MSPLTPRGSGAPAPGWLRYLWCAGLGGGVAGLISAVLANHLYLAPLQSGYPDWCGFGDALARANADLLIVLGILLGATSGICIAKLPHVRQSGGASRTSDQPRQAQHNLN